MKRFLLVVVLVSAVSGLSFSQSGCASPGNDGKPAAVNSVDGAKATNTVDTATRAGFDRSAIEKELIQIENDWARVMQSRDSEVLKRVLADDIIVTYPDGTVGDKSREISDIESNAVAAEACAHRDIKVNVLSADTAVVTGRTIIEGGRSRNKDGKTQDNSGEYRWTDTFVKRDGRWQCVASQGTLAAKS